MSNLLAIPFKKTYALDLKEPTRNFIYAHGGGHPDEFRADIDTWQKLRNDGVGGVARIDRIHTSLLYHAQLASILTKLPADIGLAIAYAPVFDPEAIPVTLNSLVFERCAVLFNLAALYSQLAVVEDRSQQDGIKRATAYFQYAAGVLSFLITSILPTLILAHDEEQVPQDLSKAFIKSMEWLMLAQAQECSWQLAKLSSYKNGLIAKIAAKVAALYLSSAQTIREASIKSLFPPEWLPHIEAKALHFAAVAQYRKSVDEIEANRYGVEIARLLEAQANVNKAFDIARRGHMATPVIQDIQSLTEIVQSNLARAERDNDLIYHHDIPASTALTSIAQTNLVNAIIPPGLSDSIGLIGSNRTLFAELLGWGAREAMNIYNERKENLIGDKIVNVSMELQRVVDETLRNLNLPAALEALELPIGLPPSLLRKAEEIRLEEGPSRIEQSIDDIERLARQNVSILDEAMDILDSEASEDEAARKHAPLKRLPSHEANAEIVEKEQRYRTILAQAASSDDVVRRKWDEWERNITELTWSEEVLSASVPSSVVSGLTMEGKQTQTHARALRAKIEDLEDLHRIRNQIVRRAQKRLTNDDIQSRIVQVASSFEKITKVEPAMFEDVLDEEIAKYDKFLKEMNDASQRQSVILTEIRHLNDLFLQSRKDDPAVKAREHAFQSLDLAYHKYREIIRNLDEGFKFYNDLSTILFEFKESCKSWCHIRSQEVHSLTRSLGAMSMEETSPNSYNAVIGGSFTAPSAPRKPVSNQTSPRKSSGLPSLSSSEWGFEDVQLLLPPPSKKRN